MRQYMMIHRKKKSAVLMKILKLAAANDRMAVAPLKQLIIILMVTAMGIKNQASSATCSILTAMDMKKVQLKYLHLHTGTLTATATAMPTRTLAVRNQNHSLMAGLIVLPSFVKTAMLTCTMFWDR